MGKIVYCIIANLLCLGAVAFAQPAPVDSAQTVQPPPVKYDTNYATPFIIGEIYIEGNKKTKPYIIERELPFKRGDSIYLPELVQGFEISRQQLINTALYNEVIISLKSFRGYYVDIQIQVKERWYIFPIPYLKPVDRNLAEWAKQGWGLDRVNYGFKFTYNNFTGRNDKLKLWLITGYTQQIQFQYDQPNADKTLKHGYRLGFFYSYNREVNYATQENQQSFVDTLRDGIKQWSANIDYTYRPGLRTVHSLRLGFTHQTVDQGIVELNPKYYGESLTKISYPELSYQVNYVNVDYKPFPLKGLIAEANVLRRGIHADMNMWQFAGKSTRSWQLSKKNFFAMQAYGVLRLPFDQPYVNQRMFGYNDLYLRGLEKYVIDGVAAFMARNSMRRELFKFSIPTYLKSRSHDRIPFRIYARLFGDAGYAYNKKSTVVYVNSLSNKFLYTGGFGLDMVSFYDFVLRLDYSFNQLSQNGLFLHIKNDF